MEAMLSSPQQACYLTSAIELVTKAAAKGRSSLPRGSDAHVLPIGFDDIAAHAIARVKEVTSDDANSIALGIGLASSLSALKGCPNEADFERILNLLRRSGLPIYDERLEVNGLWKHTKIAVEERCEAFAFLVPVAPGKAGPLKVTELSRENIRAAPAILYANSQECYGSKTALAPVVAVTGKGIYEQTLTEDVRYHVASVSDIFNRNNPTLIQGYCANYTSKRKRKVLVVVDNYSDTIVADIREYFSTHCSTINDFRILPMRVSSKSKNMHAVLKIVDAAVEFTMSHFDLIIVLGGGTIMDTVGFAAAMYKGGIPYVRIPTTLVGMDRRWNWS